MMAKEDNQNTLKQLYCIQYPGNVRNEDRAIETLGGINSISNAFSNNQKKLELRFRPEDRFCNAAAGEFNKTVSFLLKVTIKRKKSRNKEEEPPICYVSVVGRIVRTFAFKNLMDYQYLPAETDSQGNFESIYDKIVPKSIVPFSWLSEPAPVFLLPQFFSRIDSIQPYLASNKTVDDPGAVIGRTRDRRSNYVRFVSHEVKDVPKKPNPSTLRYIKLKMISEDEIMRIKELFDIRPIWTKTALVYITKFSSVQIKYLLSLRAYHFTSGPFRIAWVKFGYDPREDPLAMKYQIIDFRLRVNVLTAVRELNPNWRYGITRPKLPTTEEEINALGENSYTFKPGFIPPHRQMFYQLCDIKISEVEEKLKEHAKIAKYDPKYGWLTESLIEFIREQMDKHIIAEIQRRTPGCSANNVAEMFLSRKSIVDDDQESDDSSYDFSDQDDHDDGSTEIVNEESLPLDKNYPDEEE